MKTLSLSCLLLCSVGCPGPRLDAVSAEPVGGSSPTCLASAEPERSANAACGGDDGSCVAARSGAGHAAAGAERGAAGETGEPDAAVSDTPFAFEVKNVPSAIDMRDTGELAFNTANCWAAPTIDTSSGEIDGCELNDESFSFRYQEIDQPDTSLGTLPAALFVTKRFVIEQGMRVVVTGNRPLIIVARDEALISGQLEAAAIGEQATGGGFGPAMQGQNGLGPGGGGKVQGRSGAGGGGFCGRGGSGGEVDGLAAQGGKTYGNAENVPLIGGSSGAKFDYIVGGGGGAIQISAGRRVEVNALGVIHVGGGGGAPLANAGGSGGAILLEAPDVRVVGHLAANGGGGAATTHTPGAEGANASADDQPALGGRAQDDAASGGDGSAGSEIDGKPGAPAAADSGGQGGGGGGGAGRIRINTLAGKADLAGALISPGIETPCFTQGRLE